MGSDKPSRPDDDGPLSDLYQDSQIQIDPALKARLRTAAPEVSQGAWRERAFTPRSTLTAEEIAQGLKAALKAALIGSPSPSSAPDEARRELKGAWLPFVRQAVEQAGGDGVDAVVWAVIGKKAPAAKAPFVSELLRGYAAMNAADTIDAFLGEAGKVQSLIDRAVSAEHPPRLSFKALEKDLQGRIDLDEMLVLLSSTDEELSARLVEVKSSLDNLRSELKAFMGAQPNALLWNFSRLKAERLIIEGEQRRRAN